MEFSSSEVRSYYGSRIQNLKQNGKELRGACPVHNGHDDNFAIELETGMSYCHSQCGRGFDMIGLEQELSGRGFVEARDAVFAVVGRPKVAWEDRDIVSTYDYCDTEGKIVYQVVRKVPKPDGTKDFSQRRPDGHGKWIWGLGNAAVVPFMLPKVAAAQFVGIVEGEKDALTLSRYGLVATCNNGGAGNFKPEIVPYFAGKKVAVFFDNDDAGRKHALKVAGMLSGAAASVRIVELPGLGHKQDVTDFLVKGGTVNQIRERYKIAQEWSPEWQFSVDEVNENDKYVRTPAQIINDCGGLQKFWALPEDEGVSTPFPILNRALAGGLRNGEVYVLGANQGAGKTSLGLQFAIAALRNRRGVLIFSMEMGHKDILQRMASIEARVDLIEFRRLQRRRNEVDMDLNEMRKELGRRTGELAEFPLMVSTKGGVTPEYLQEETARLRNRERIDLVVVDHMQLMAATGSVRGDYEKFTSISRTLKQTAMEVKIPVLLISQTSRSNSAAMRSELEVSDLRGCIDKSALVLMADGSRKRMKDMRAGDCILSMRDDQKFVPSVVQEAWCSGTQPTFKLRTRFGREIVATENHPFLTAIGWKPLSELRLGLQVAGVLSAPVQGTCTEEQARLCRFAGYMVGNGSYIKHRGISFVTPDSEVMEDFCSIVRNVFPTVTIRVDDCDTYYELDLVRILDNGYGAPFANPIRNWIRDNGMAAKFNEKRVPAFVFDRGARGAAEFISGYLMTDGCIKAGRAYSVCFDTTSHALAKDVQHLLCRLGVAGVVGNPSMNTKSTVPMYRVSVVRQVANTRRLLSSLTLFGKNKKKAGEQLQNAIIRDENSHLLGLPREYSVAISKADWRLWRNTDKGIGRSKAREIGAALGNETFRQWADSDVLWDEITLIEPHGEIETWDMRVLKSHNFTVNDFVVHNSGAIEEDACAVLLLYPEKEDRERALAEGRFAKGPLRTVLKLGKNRYGWQGVEIPLMHHKTCTRFDLIEEHEAQS